MRGGQYCDGIGGCWVLAMVALQRWVIGSRNHPEGWSIVGFFR